MPKQMTSTDGAGLHDKLIGKWIMNLVIGVSEVIPTPFTTR